MTTHVTTHGPHDGDVAALRERAKELRCLYAVHAALAQRDAPLATTFLRVLEALPPAWQHPDRASARIEYFGRTHALPGFVPSAVRQSAPLRIWQTPVGVVEVVYRDDGETLHGNAFLREEQQLLDAVAARVSEYLEWKQRELGGERLGAEPEHWRWRQRFAERIAREVGATPWGVRAVYLHGSTESGEAHVGSDIDLVIEFAGGERERALLDAWLQGWNLCLAELRSQLHGVEGDAVLDVRIATPTEVAALRVAAARDGRSLRELSLT